MSKEDTTEITYDAINFDGLERRANYRTVTYRIDMLHVFDRKDAAATLYGIIYRWQFEVKRVEVLREIERRRKANLPPLTQEEAEAMMWVYMSYNDFVRETGNAIAYNTVIRLIDYLVNDVKAIEQQPNTDKRFADFMYRINKEVVKPLLKALPTEPTFAPKVPKKKKKSTHLGRAKGQYTQMGRPDKRSTQMGIHSTQMGIQVYPNGGTSHTTHSNTHTSSQDDTCVGEGANAPAHTPEISDDSETGLEDTVKSQAVRIAKPLQPTAEPVAPATVGTLPAMTSPLLPPMPPSEPYTPQTIVQLFDHWRKHPLLADRKQQEALKYAKALHRVYSYDEIRALKLAMDADTYYADRGGADIADMANNEFKYQQHIPHYLAVLRTGGGGSSNDTNGFVPHPSRDECECIDEIYQIYRWPPDGSLWYVCGQNLYTWEEIVSFGLARSFPKEVWPYAEGAVR